MIYIRKHKVIFLHLTKTGGESVLEALNAPGKRLKNYLRPESLG